jgi:hypothetical protein
MFTEYLTGLRLLKGNGRGTGRADEILVVKSIWGISQTEHMHKPMCIIGCFNPCQSVASVVKMNPGVKKYKKVQEVAHPVENEKPASPLLTKTQWKTVQNQCKKVQPSTKEYNPNTGRPVPRPERHSAAS